MIIINVINHDEPIQKISENPFLQIDFTERILKLSEQVAETNERLTTLNQRHADTVAELEQKKAEIVILNNERANMTAAIQRRQDDLKELTFYRGECERLRSENETLRNKKRFSWWPFGGRD